MPRRSPAARTSPLACRRRWHFSPTLQSSRHPSRSLPLSADGLRPTLLLSASCPRVPARAGGRYRTSSLDPKRAAKATPELRDKWFAKVDGYVRRLYSEGKIPWPTFDKIPARCKYNVDEDAANAAKGRSMGLAAVGSGAGASARVCPAATSFTAAFTVWD